VAVLLTLLHLGVKNIRLGPNLPAFVTPEALSLLVEKFGIKAADTRHPEEEIQRILPGTGHESLSGWDADGHEACQDGMQISMCLALHLALCVDAELCPAAAACQDPPCHEAHSMQQSGLTATAGSTD